MRTAQGAIRVREFSKQRQHRKNAQPIRSLQADQRLECSPWAALAARSTKVDIERVNAKGLFYSQPAPDPTPRLVRRESSRPFGDPLPATFNPTIDPAKVREWLRS